MSRGPGSTRAAVAVIASILLAGCAGTGQPGGTSTTSGRPSPSATSTTAPPSTPGVGHDAWVSVSVATLWRSPKSPRPVDGPALRSPVAIQDWLSDMSTADRLGLVGRADSQVLLGDRVHVIGMSGGFAEVVVPDQPTPQDPRGYPGWIPLVQLGGLPPPNSGTTATVVSRTAWLRAEEAPAERVVEVSFGTRLPALGVAAGLVRVGLPGGQVLGVAASEVSVTPVGEPALPPEGPALVRSATMFTGLPYLWAGASGFGLDCSGLTWLVLRVHGVRIPRDAGPQSLAGEPVGRGAFEQGDLLFYATDGQVHHVAMYVGGGLMVHAPSTGHAVETIPVETPALAAEFSGARRVVP